MIFEDAPAPLDEVVLAVIGRVVRQFQRQLIAVREFDQAFHELGPGTGDLRAVVQIDQQPTYARMNELNAILLTRNGYSLVDHILLAALLLLLLLPLFLIILFL